MRLVVDALELERSSGRGIATYLTGVLDELAGCRDLDISALAFRSTSLPAGIRRHTVRRGAPGRWRAREDTIMLPLDLLRAHRRNSREVVWAPGLTSPWLTRAPVVATLHDLVPLVFTDDHYAAERARWRTMAPRVRRAGAVVAVSTWSAEQGVRLLGLDPGRVHVALHGVSSVFQPATHVTDQDVPYLLLVSQFDVRKRFDIAFDMISRLADRGFPHLLRVVGAISPWYRERLASLVARTGHPERVELLGHVDLHDLVKLYQGAAAVVSTSACEGFGLPLVEAMACGSPVIAFDNSAIPEVLGDAGVLVPDGDEAAFADAVSVVLTTSDRAGLRTRALARARKFSWATSAQVHRNAFEQAADG